MNIGILLLTHNDIGAQLLLAAKSTYGSIPFRTELLSIDHYDQPTDLINLAQQYVKVLDSGGSGSFAEVMKGMEWTIDNKIKYNIRAASMSLGGVWLIELTQEQEERITHLANEMVAAGISLMIAAGNSAGYGTIGTPGAAKDVITVGSTEDSKDLAVYSSKGPTHEGQIKPNVAAIGSAVMSLSLIHI